MKLTNKELRTLLDALDCFIDAEQDSKNHTTLYNKIHKELFPFKVKSMNKRYKQILEREADLWNDLVRLSKRKKR